MSDEYATASAQSRQLGKDDKLTALRDSYKILVEQNALEHYRWVAHFRFFFGVQLAILAGSFVYDVGRPGGVMLVIVTAIVLVCGHSSLSNIRTAIDLRYMQCRDIEHRLGLFPIYRQGYDLFRAGVPVAPLWNLQEQFVLPPRPRPVTFWQSTAFDLLCLLGFVVALLYIAKCGWVPLGKG